VVSIVRKIQTAFAAGQIAATMLMRRDTSEYNEGALSLQNFRMLVTGGTTRRPGTWWKGTLPGGGIVIPFLVNEGDQYWLCFVDGAMYAFTVDGATAGSITGAPWTLAQVQSMTWAAAGNTLFLVHPTLPVQQITRTGASTWTVADFAFSTEGEQVNQPYYFVAPQGTTLAPSDYTGSVTLTLNNPWFVAGHVGQIVRYVGQQILITAVSSSTSATGTVLVELPATQVLTVNSTTGFSIGDVITGETSAAQGQVTSIDAGVSLTIYINDGLTGFAVETVTGPNASTSCTEVTNDDTPAAVTDWDEALFNSVNGYPQAVVIHDGRLGFGGHTAVPNALMMSTTTSYFDFNVGTGSASDAIFDLIGDSPSIQINQLVSAEQLLLLTNVGGYYVPENYFNPFEPANIAFYPFGDRVPILSTPRADRFDDGVIFVSGSTVYLANATGSLISMWHAEPISLMSYDQFDNPMSAAYVYNFNSEPCGYVLFTNANGTAVSMLLVGSQKIRSFTPWTLTDEGTILSMAGMQSALAMLTERTIGGSTTYLLEIFDQTCTLDAATNFTDLSTVTGTYGTEADLCVVQGYWSLGTYPVPSEFQPGGTYTVGLNFETELQTLPPEVEMPGGTKTGLYKRIARAQVYTLKSGPITVAGPGNSYANSSYTMADDLSQPPPPITGPQDFRLNGWVIDPTVTITQNDPLPLTILGMTMDIAA
jgi:hypothetical protein